MTTIAHHPIEPSRRSQLEIRNLRFETESGRVPRHWSGGRKSVTTFYDTLSLFFPDGETFFVDAVRAHKDVISEQSLRDDVVRFCGQEGIHSREHARYNAMLEAQGYPAARLQRRVGRILRGVRKVFSPRAQLAATCALEHCTAVLARFVTCEPRMFEDADPVMRSLWLWHAAEEYEHRAVAFDVYAAVKAPYLERASVMLLASAIFCGLLVEHQYEMMRADGTHRSAQEWRDLATYLFVEPGGMRSLFREWLAYFRPGFHPLDRRDVTMDDAVEDWRDAYASRRTAA